MTIAEGLWGELRLLCMNRAGWERDPKHLKDGCLTTGGKQKTCKFEGCPVVKKLRASGKYEPIFKER